MTRAGPRWGPVVHLVGLASDYKNALVCFSGLWPWAGPGQVRVESPGALEG